MPITAYFGIEICNVAPEGWTPDPAERSSDEHWHLFLPA
jgi:hypothetical protein